MISIVVRPEAVTPKSKGMIKFFIEFSLYQDIISEEIAIEKLRLSVYIDLHEYFWI